jgi:tRNA threonylcarbamoyladenosine modification (KEOPS) complex  Pcc1 subunit
MKISSEYNKICLEITDIRKKDSGIFIEMKYHNITIEISATDLQASIEKGDWIITD